LCSLTMPLPSSQRRSRQQRCMPYSAHHAQAKDDPYDSTRMKKELPKALKALNPGRHVA
jgi:hypothetical protein